MATPDGGKGPQDNALWLGIRRSALGEILVFFAAALIFDVLFLDGSRFVGMQPHPFWLLVLLIAAHYGTPAGVFASVLGTLLAFAGNLPARDPLVNQSVYLLSVMAQPVLWFASAVVLGELRTRQERRNIALQQEVERLSGERDELRTGVAALEEANERLQTRAAGRVNTAVSLVEAGRALDTRQPSTVFAGVERLITSLLSPTAYSIYLCGEEGLDLAVHVTDGKRPEAAKHYPKSSALYQAIVEGQQVLQVADTEGQRVLADEGVLAGPLLDMKAGKALGMLKVEALPLTNLQHETIAAFGSLCEWIGNAYRAAQDFEEANRSAVFHRGSQLFTHAYYQPVSAFIVALAERAHFAVTQLTVRVQPQRGNGSDDKEQICTAVQRAVEAGLRTTDLAFNLEQERGEYVVLLPMTPLSKGQLVADRLRAAIESGLRERGFEARLSVTFEAMYVPTAADLKPWRRAVIRRTDPYT